MKKELIQVLNHIYMAYKGKARKGARQCLNDDIGDAGLPSKPVMPGAA